ncbi:uncharacterized protein LOC119377317 [Rhipicephalus sanguineus]|uniref:uncharacterized protein LOC119377317 n=1 Tax=Rhipicephalus sanguineus TaxID=34632 RepID=UPI001895CA59|nr:uncharacterized protein LOC119377317 [Rhipicephalus sanguineus]
MLREIEKLTSQLNDIEMEVEEECDNDGNASPRHHFRPTRSELEEKIQRLERENRRQRLRLAAQRSIMRSTSEVQKKELLNNFAQTSPVLDKAEKTQVRYDKKQSVSLPDRRSLPSFRGFTSASTVQEDIESPTEETPAKVDMDTQGALDRQNTAEIHECKEEECAPLGPLEDNVTSDQDVAEPQVLLVNGKGASLVRLYEETVRVAKEWRADALRRTDGSSSGDKETLPSMEEKVSQTSQLGRQTSLDRLKDHIILEQLGHLEAFQEMSAMRIKCLQRRLEQSVPKEVFKSLSEAYSKLAASQTRLLARVADAAIADNKLAEEVCASTDTGMRPHSYDIERSAIESVQGPTDFLYSKLRIKKGVILTLVVRMRWRLT